MILKGNPVSSGIAIAKAFVYRPLDLSVEEKHIDASQSESELDNVRRALKRACGELEGLIASFPEGEEEQAKIFRAHIEIIEDEELFDAIRESVETEGLCAEAAVDGACGLFASLLGGAQDANIAMRASDINDVRNRIIRCLRGEAERNLSHLSRDCVIIAHELLPSDTASMDRAHVLGIISEEGGTTSHTAILAKSFGIPALLGVSEATRLIKDGELLLLDALSGYVNLQPTEAQLQEGEKAKQKWLEERELAEKYLKKKAKTTDGFEIDTGVNIGSDQDDIPEYADFVGLFRTEFLYMNSAHLPTEDEQLAAYRRVLEKAGDKPVTLRTLDIGGDKSLPYLPLPKEENPFLGMRALRLCLEKPELFRTQLRAAYRASAYGKLQIMFPMVTGLEDARKALAFARQVREELALEGKTLAQYVPLGVMIEIPSAALCADLLAKELDFASIGTNDLTQYICAADRMNPKLGEYYQPLSPAMLRTLSFVSKAFGAAGKPLSVCGELAGDPKAACLLLGMGINKLSMSQSCLAQVKAEMQKYSLKRLQKLAADALRSTTAEELEMLLTSAAEE